MEGVFAAKRKQQLSKLGWLPPYFGLVQEFSICSPFTESFIYGGAPFLLYRLELLVGEW